MEPDIYSSLPKASPILAYGEAREPKGKKILALIAGLFIVGILVVGVWAAAAWTVTFPTQTPVIILIHGGTELPETFPAIWKAAARANHPTIIGLAKTQNGLKAFSLGLWSDESAGTERVQHGPIVLQSEGSLTDLASQPARGFMGQIFGLGSHQAVLSIDLSSLGVADGMLAGPIDGGTWHPDAQLAQSASSIELPAGDISLDLDTLPEAWPAVQEILAGPPLGLDLDQRPTAIGIIFGTSSTTRIELRFAEQPTASTLQTMALASGIYDYKPYDLPDGSAAEELEPPAQPSGTTSTGHTLILGPTTSSQASLSTSCGNAPVVAFFSSSTIERMSKSLGIDLNMGVNAIEVLNDSGKPSICAF